MNRSEAMEKAFATIVKRVNQAIATDDSQFLTGALLHIRDVAKAAVALPRRQYDVGTPAEQAQRFYNFCESNSSGINGMCNQKCPCIDCFDKCQCLCKWAQMPYEAEEGGVK